MRKRKATDQEPASELSSWRLRVRDLQRIPAAGNAPELVMRHYRGDLTVASHLLTFSRDLILPPSYKHPHKPSLWNERLLEQDAKSGLTPPPGRVKVSGDFYNLNTAIPGHFGHLMVEAVTRLWGWDAARARFPKLRGYHRIPQGYDPSVERELFAAYGIHDVHWAEEDERVSSFVSAAPMWHNSGTIWWHPRVTETWERLRSLVHPSDVDRLFVSRRPGNRTCRNAAEVEQYFTDRGFLVVYPEDHSLAEQASLFGHAEVIAGFAGSAMFNVIFGRPKRMIVLTHDEYSAPNERMYADALGFRLERVVSPADISSGGKWSVEAFHSGWEFTAWDELARVT